MTPLGQLGEPIRIEYVPRSGLLGLSIVNFLLGVVTFSIYRFWAKTNVRRHIWSCVHINGQPLEYTGLGIELFKGAMFVFLVLGLPTIIAMSVVSITLGPEHPAIAGIQAILFLVAGLLWGAAIYRARRYQLSRTLWRGIRGTLSGSSMNYSLTYFGAMIARFMTLGWSTPALNTSLQRIIIGDMSFGDRSFSFKGRSGPLYPAYAACWVLTLVALIAATAAAGAFIYGMGFGHFFEVLTNTESESSGAEAGMAVLSIAGIFAGLLVLGTLYSIVWSFYTARELRVFADYARFDNARFRYDATAGSLIWLAIGNLLIWIFTIGIGRPYVSQRLVRYLCDRMTVEGTIDVDTIRQSTAPLDKMGEGLADAFDIGGI